MNTKRLLLAFAALSVVFTACKHDEDIDNPVVTNPNEYVNTWIQSTLKDYYYWSAKLPSSPDLTLKPDAFFESMLYRFNKTTAPDGDRFSWIESDYTKLISSLNGVASNEVGFDFSVYYKDDTQNNLIAQVNYVKKGTPAETKGVKRGMLFDKVDGQLLTLANYQELLTFTNTECTLGVVEPVFDDQGYASGFQTLGNLTLQTVANFAENPVYLDTVYTINGHKIGYFVYHFFSPDKGDNSYKYDKAMNEAFGRLKAAGITDLVLDLRYNSGGRTTSSQLLASEIVPDLSDDKLYVYYRYNPELNDAYVKQYGNDALNTYFVTHLQLGQVEGDAVNNVGNRLGGKVYVLTGSHTASASEQVINGLKPFMNVVLIGDTTYGKNVASTTFYDEDHTDKNKWGMQPIIAKFFNSAGQSDFTAGFAPDYAVRDGGLSMKEFGDTSEPLLNTALTAILGASQKMPAASSFAKQVLLSGKGLSVPGLRIRGTVIDNSTFLK